MAEVIQGVTSTFFPDSRPQKRDGEKKDDFARWLAKEPEANTNTAPPVNFFTPTTSMEDLLILAQAREERFAAAVKAYETTAHMLHEEGVEDSGQYVFEFVLQDEHPGDVMSAEV